MPRAVPDVHVAGGASAAAPDRQRRSPPDAARPRGRPGGRRALGRVQSAARRATKRTVQLSRDRLSPRQTASGCRRPGRSSSRRSASTPSLTTGQLTLDISAGVPPSRSRHARNRLQVLRVHRAPVRIDRAPASPGRASDSPRVHVRRDSRALARDGRASLLGAAGNARPGLADSRSDAGGRRRSRGLSRSPAQPSLSLIGFRRAVTRCRGSPPQARFPDKRLHFRTARGAAGGVLRTSLRLEPEDQPHLAQGSGRRRSIGCCWSRSSRRGTSVSERPQHHRHRLRRRFAGDSIQACLPRRAFDDGGGEGAEIGVSARSGSEARADRRARRNRPLRGAARQARAPRIERRRVRSSRARRGSRADDAAGVSRARRLAGALSRSRRPLDPLPSSFHPWNFPGPIP